MCVLTLNSPECTVVLGPRTPLSWALWIHVYIIKLKETESGKVFWLKIQSRVCVAIKYQQPQKVDFHLSSENAPTRGDWANWAVGNLVCPPQLLLCPACPAHFSPPITSLRLFLLPSHPSILALGKAGLSAQCQWICSMRYLPSASLLPLIMGGGFCPLKSIEGSLEGYGGLRKEMSSGNLDQEKHHLKMPKLTKLSLGHLLLARSP